MMILTVAVAALALPGVGATAAAVTVAARDFNSCGYYPTTTVHLRKGPGAHYASLGLLNKTDAVDADKATNGWYRVTLTEKARSGLRAGTSGWVAKKYLTPAVCTQLN
ncbi:SH3 domain-containing protein [Streptomyces marianii]|nr:SH3 domain-containing protein [Streptomyces marianii]